MKEFSNAAAKQRIITWAVIGALLFTIIGFVLGWLWMEIRYPMLREPAFRNFTVSYNTIMSKYLNGAKSEDLINGASQGMLASLGDPYSRYLIKEQGSAYTQGYEGEFSGVGITLQEADGKFIVASLTEDAPAVRGGVHAGDEIVGVNGTSIKGKAYEDIITILRGDVGTKVKLSLQRGGSAKPIEVELTREAIAVHTVTSEMLSGGIGHVTISKFGQKTDEEFKTEVEKLQKEGMTKLLLDLRSNPGGLLQSTIKIANMLVPKDKVILQVVYKDHANTITYKSKQDKPWTIPIVVLVNGQSASASEVLTAALKESAGATVVGEKTFGKGIVQTFQQFKDNSVLSLTEAQWKTPGGTWIHKQGVTPDVTVDLPAYASLSQLPFGTELEIGSYGDNVKTLQLMLKELGYSPVGDIGLYNEQTADALSKFQKDEQLAITGKFNDVTGYRILELLSNKLKEEDTQLHKGMAILNEK
ncbi:S41 family peptidase [Paenibacillus glycanilyticus]|uniref:Peptidase S41 n=1 Tax=Paenibacillus glycanilyticus TaxID=126569 RepID=A0ABQ6GBQ0_9BACL|nr:S41 family peptidase [Paenibacillus glycanilyticus]GLX67658.1 peptidase S41 [Paenibacillus glycanilyticus]